MDPSQPLQPLPPPQPPLPLPLPTSQQQQKQQLILSSSSSQSSSSLPSSVPLSSTPRDEPAPQPATVGPYISFNPDQPPPPLLPHSCVHTVGSLLTKPSTSTSTAAAAAEAAAISRHIVGSTCLCAHSHGCGSNNNSSDSNPTTTAAGNASCCDGGGGGGGGSGGGECGCNKNGCDPCNICRLELLSYPRDNMRDSYCYLQGCTPIHYRFKFKLHTTEDKKYLGSAFLSAILLAKVTKQNGVEMERIIEDGLKGDSYTPFDPKSGECLIKISFQTAGRGAPWIIRFIASTSEPVTSESILKQTDSCGVTGVPGCKGCEMYNATAAAAALAAASTGIGPGGTMTADPTKQAVTMTELCHYDFPVKTYSKKAKITKILKGTDGVPTEKVSIVPHKITFHAHELGGTGTGSSNTSGTSNNGSSSGSNSSANGATATIATTAQVGGNGSGSGSGSNSIGSTVTTGGSVVGPLNSATTVVTAGMNSSVIVGSGCAPNGTISGSTSITGASLLGSGGAGGGPMGNDIGNDLAGIMAGSSGGGSVIARVGCGCNDSSSLIDEPIRLDPEQIQLYQRQQRQQQQQQRQQQPQQTQQPVGGPELGEELVDLHSPPRKYLCQIQSQIPIPMMGPTATQNDGGKVLWDTDFEATLNQIFESVASENGAFPLSRHLTKEDMQFVCNACTLPEYAGVQGAQLWISKAAAGVAKIRRLWDAQNPMLIAGFISKDCTQRILSQCQPGTFMLRFSSGDPGELIIAFVVANEAGNTFVEQSYLVQDNEELSEAVVVERVLENRLFLNGLDIMSSTTFTKELYRPRSRYSKLNSMPI